MTSELRVLFSRNKRFLLSCIAALTVFAGIILTGWLTQRTVHIQIRLDTPMPDGVRVYCRTAPREGFGEAQCITVPTSETPAVADVLVPAHQLYGLKVDFGCTSGEFTIIGGIVGNIPLPPWKYWVFSPNITIQGGIGEALKLHLSDDGADHYMQVSFRRPITSSSKPRVLSRGRFLLLLPLALAAALATGTFCLQGVGIVQPSKNAVSILSWSCLLFVTFFFFRVGIRMASCGYDMIDHIEVANGIDLTDLRHPIVFWNTHYYPIWHLLVKLVKLAFHLESSVIAAGVVNGFCYNACLCGIFLYLRRSFQSVNPCWLICMAFVVCTCGCMLGPGLNIDYLYENTHNKWHNPTNYMVMPLALPCVLLTVSLLNRTLRLNSELTQSSYSNPTSNQRGKMQWSLIVSLALTLTLTELAKPSFIQVYLPAMFLFLAGYCFVSRISLLPLLHIALALLAPCLVLLAQYMLAFDPNGGGGIGFGFLKVLGHYRYFWLNQLYAIAFPIAALSTAIIRRRMCTEDVLCWLMLLVGTGIRLFLFEQGPRMMHGNLGWGHAVALYLVWVMSVRQYVDLAFSQKGISGRLGFWTLSILLVLHALTGFWKMYAMICLGQVI